MRSDLDMEEKQRSFQRHCWTPVAHNKARRKKPASRWFFQQSQGLNLNAGPVPLLGCCHFGIRLGFCLGGCFSRFLFGFGLGATLRFVFCSGLHISFGIFGCSHGCSGCCGSCCSFGCGRVCCCGSRSSDSCRRQSGRLGKGSGSKETGNEGGEQLVHDQNSFIRFSVQHFVELATTTPPAPVLMTHWAPQL